MIIKGRDYEHTLALSSGAIMPAGARYEIAELGPLVQAILKGEPFDAAEFSLAALIILADRGMAPPAVPVFPARAFYQSCLWVRAGAPLHSFGDLAGKKIVLRDYTSTTSVWFRAELKADHGVNWTDVEWLCGPSRRFPPPAEARVTQAGGDLEDLLVNGRADAFFSTRTRDQRLPPSRRRLRPLLPDPQAAEAGWFDRTGIYPIQHVVVVSRDLPAEAPRQVFDLYSGAKQAGLKRRLGMTMMPWSEPLWDRISERFGADPLPYGLGPANRRTIAALIDALFDQKLIARRIDIDELFVAGSAGWSETDNGKDA